MGGGEKNLWIIANWKSNKSIAEALEWVSLVGSKVLASEEVKVVVCPEFSAVEEVKKAVLVGNYSLLVGVQDLSPFPPGAFTGEESGQDLKQFASVVIIGHSERRKNFGETDEMVAEKVKRSLEVGMTPLVCVQGKETPVPEGCNLVAFEPVEAIGTGHPDTPGDANEVAQFLKDKYGERLEVLYGGSVIPENAEAFTKQENISGLLVGGASLSAEQFLAIIENVTR